MSKLNERSNIFGAVEKSKKEPAVMGVLEKRAIIKSLFLIDGYIPLSVESSKIYSPKDGETQFRVPLENYILLPKELVEFASDAEVLFTQAAKLAKEIQWGWTNCIPTPISKEQLVQFMIYMGVTAMYFSETNNRAADNRPILIVTSEVSEKDQAITYSLVGECLGL